MQNPKCWTAVLKWFCGHCIASSSPQTIIKPSILLSITLNIKSYCSSGAASLGKGIGGILFSRFSRSSSQVGGVEEEPSDSEGAASEVENVTSGDEKETVAETEEKDKQIEESQDLEPTMSQSTSAVIDSTSCKYCVSVEKLVNLFKHDKNLFFYE